MVKKGLLHIVFWFITFGIYAQEYVHLTIKPQTVEVNQSVSVTIKTNVDGKINLNLPEGFVRSGGIQNGFSTSVINTNGQRNIVRNRIQSFSGHFTKKGTYLFGPATIKNSKNTYKSDVINIEVIAHHDMISSDPAKNMNKIAFGIIQQSQRTVYVGEPFVISGKVYSQADILNVKSFTPFGVSGQLQKQLLSHSNKVNVAYENISGRQVQTFEIGKTVLFATKAGTIKVDPFKTELLYNSPRSFFPRQLNLTSNATTVKVLPLPNNQPSSYTGGVGKMKLSASLHTDHVVEGNIVELKVNINGYGNLQHITAPHLKLPDGFSIYGKTEIHDSLTYTQRGAEGQRIFTYFIQCNKVGKTQLSPIRMAYFNPKAKSYKVLQADILPLFITKSTRGVGQSPLASVEDGMLPQLKPFITKKGRYYDHQGLSLGWKTTLLASPLLLGSLFGLFLLIKGKSNQKEEKKKAKSIHRTVALKELQDLKTSSNQLSIDDIYKVLTTFLATELHTTTGNISRKSLKQHISKSLTEEQYQSIVVIFNQLDQLRFSGMFSSVDKEKIIAQVTSIIHSFTA